MRLHEFGIRWSPRAATRSAGWSRKRVLIAWCQDFSPGLCRASRSSAPRWVLLSNIYQGIIYHLPFVIYQVLSTRYQGIKYHLCVSPTAVLGYHLPGIIFLPGTVYKVPPIIYRLSSTKCQLSSIFYRLSSSFYQGFHHSSSILYQVSSINA